jgi:hypothetical protein
MLFIKDVFDLPYWVLYIEIAVYSLLSFLIVYNFFKLLNAKSKLKKYKKSLAKIKKDHIDKLNDNDMLIITAFFSNDTVKEDSANLLKMKMTELRPIARDLKIKNWWNIRKEKLVTIIINTKK